MVKDGCAVGSMTPAGDEISSSRRLARLGELVPQRTHLLEASRDVPHDRRHANHLARLIAKWHDREFERNARSILPDSGNGENIAMAVPRLSPVVIT
jgi:hypothetical protein